MGVGSSRRLPVVDMVRIQYSILRNYSSETILQDFTTTFFSLFLLSRLSSLGLRVLSSGFYFIWRFAGAEKTMTSRIQIPGVVAVKFYLLRYGEGGWVTSCLLSYLETGE